MSGGCIRWGDCVSEFLLPVFFYSEKIYHMVGGDVGSDDVKAGRDGCCERIRLLRFGQSILCQT